MPWIYILSLWLSLALAGCGPAISTNLRREAVTPPNLTVLEKQPQQYQGKLVILGGEIISVTAKGGKSIMEVSQKDLDERLRPLDTEGHGRSFFVESDEWLNRGFYVPERKVTVAGEVLGQMQGVPLLKAKEIHLFQYPGFEEWYYPIPREWYGYDPVYEYWYTPPYFDPWRGGGGKH